MRPRRNVLGVPSLSSGICLPSAVRGFRSHRRGHLGFDEPGRDRIDQDVARAELLGDRLGQRDQARLAGGVVRLTLVADDADDARDVDDPAAAPLHHAARYRANCREGAAQIRIDARRPSLRP